MGKKTISKHERLYQAAEEAATELHGDTSVSVGETLNSLRSLMGHVATLIETIESTQDE